MVGATHRVAPTDIIWAWAGIDRQELWMCVGVQGLAPLQDFSGESGVFLRGCPIECPYIICHPYLASPVKERNFFTLDNVAGLCTGSGAGKDMAFFPSSHSRLTNPTDF